MSLLSDLQKLRDGATTKSVFVQSLGRDIELLPLFMSQRFALLDASDSKSFSLRLVALCIAEDGQRLSDSVDVEEILSYIEPLHETDFNDLFAAANELSKVTVSDVEEAEKNS
jgi:hypothetical protein